MALSTSLFSGITGLKAHNTMLDVIANNISNVNTTGYKKSRVNFASTISQSTGGASGPRTGSGFGGINSTQIGLGVNISSIDQIMSQGSLQNTGNVTDLAINGEGMFAVRSGNQIVFTRAGDFTFDAAGNLVDRTGAIVQGWNVETEVTARIFDSASPPGTNVLYESKYISMDRTATNTAAITNIQIHPGFTMQPSSTTRLEITGNLDAGGSSQNAITRQNNAALIDSSGIGPPGGIPIWFGAPGPVTNNDLQYSGSPQPPAVGFYFLDAAIPPGVGALNNTTDGLHDNMFVNVVPDHQMTTEVFDSLGYKREITFWYFQTTDLSTTAPPPNGPGFNAVTYAWYAFETSSAPPSIANVIGGTNIAETFDRNQVGTPPIGQFLTFNPDGSLQNQGAIRFDKTQEYKPVLYLKEVNVGPTNTNPFPVNFPQAPNTKWSMGTEQYVVVTVDFGSAWPAAATDSPGVDNWGPYGFPPVPGKLIGVAARDGLTGDATGLLDAQGNYITNNSAAVTFRDGFVEGELLSLSILNDGTIQGAFTNGQQLAMGRVALAKFSNPGGLIKIGASHYALSANSGTALMDQAQKNGRGSIQSGFLEQSNVDLVEELTQLIIAQRGFEVNSRVISTANSLLNTLVTLGQ